MSRALSLLGLLLLTGCNGSAPPTPAVTVAASAVGTEAEVIRRQIARFHTIHPDLRVEVRVTPDAADLRHQLYVQWLNARATEPDILQLDVIWTAEFAAAGWILPLDRFEVDSDAFFPAAVAANRWHGRPYALPWFIDVGMLYWRTDLVPSPPASLDELLNEATHRTVRYGLVWQGARYEGLVTVFLEYLGAFGGQILDDGGRVVVDSDASVRALDFMRNEISSHAVPEEALGWQEEQTRFAFQNGQAVFMRNWPYAVTLLQDASQSSVAGRFSIAPMPAGEGGHPASALGGSQLAINAHSRHPDTAYTFMQFLLAPEQMLERARLAGQYPSRRALYDMPELAHALGQDPMAIRQIIEHAIPRPATPVYSEISEILQVHLHRALTDQEQPRAALTTAANEMRDVLRRSGLSEGASR